MSIKNLNIFNGYQSQYQEIKFDSLPITGNIPTWLSGSFISNGPAQFEIGNIQFRHWFDGFAMLKKFDFKAGKVGFQNRFLNSQQYITSHQLRHLNSNEFATYAQCSWPNRIRQVIKDLVKGGTYDNCNINIACIANHFIAMTESSQAVEFDISNLSTIGAFQFSDTIKSQMSTAHPHWDPMTDEVINIAIEIGKTIQYHVCRIKPHSTKRDIITTYVSETLFYMHSFSITSDYIILFKSPLIINKFKVLLGTAFNDAVYWQKNKASFFITIDRKNGNINEIESEAFICLHSVNAYQNKHELILDLICHHEGNPYNHLYLSELQSEHPHFPAGALRRYVLDTHSKKCRYTTLSSSHYEFPRINYKAVNGKNYRFSYANFIEDRDIFFNGIEKFDLHTGKTERWKKENYYPGEAVFVAKTNSNREDEGVLLSIAFNSTNQCSSLIILDALIMQQLAEVSLPFHLPFGLHGNFYR